MRSAAPAAVAGDTLLHFDVRADNVLLTGERVWFVDWPHARIGAAWLDGLALAPSVTMQGGPAPSEWVNAYGPDLPGDDHLGARTVSFWADDVAAARQWYRELLGVEPYCQRPGAEHPAYVDPRPGQTTTC